MTIETLIEEMQATKQLHPTLEISDVLRIFNIQALRDLNKELFKMRLSK